MTAILLSLQKVRERYCPRASDSRLIGGMAAGKPHFKAACGKSLLKLQETRPPAACRILGRCSAQGIEITGYWRGSAVPRAAGGADPPVMRVRETSPLSRRGPGAMSLPGAHRVQPGTETAGTWKECIMKQLLILIALGVAAVGGYVLLSGQAPQEGAPETPQAESGESSTPPVTGEEESAAPAEQAADEAAEAVEEAAEEGAEAAGAAVDAVNEAADAAAEAAGAVTDAVEGAVDAVTGTAGEAADAASDAVEGATGAVEGLLDQSGAVETEGSTNSN